MDNFREKKSQENRPLAEKWQDWKSQKIGQKNKLEDMERESNDSPDIPDRRGTFEVPGFPSRRLGWGRQSVYFLCWN